MSALILTLSPTFAPNFAHVAEVSQVTFTPEEISGTDADPELAGLTPDKLYTQITYSSGVIKILTDEESANIGQYLELFNQFSIVLLSQASAAMAAQQ
jgi:hypothetical protein